MRVRSRDTRATGTVGLTLVLVAVASLATTVGAPQTASLSPFAAKRAESLLEKRVACRGCHVVAGRGGHIGPSLDGLADRAERASVLAIVRDPPASIPGTLMPRQWMPDAEMERLVDYVLAQPGSTPPPSDGVAPQAPPALADPETTDGSALYTRHCAACHGPSGEGDGWNAQSLPVAPTRHASGELMGARTDDSLFDAIYAGAYVLDGSPRMPPFGHLLSTAQIRALVAHIRTLCACTQPDWAGDR